MSRLALGRGPPRRGSVLGTGRDQFGHPPRPRATATAITSVNSRLQRPRRARPSAAAILRSPISAGPPAPAGRSSSVTCGSLQTYLRGEAVSFEEIDIPHDVAPADVRALALPRRPRQRARITWIADGAKVPVEVAASGPKVIALGRAACGNGVMFTLGADVERLTWGIRTGTAEPARRRASIPMASPSALTSTSGLS